MDAALLLKLKDNNGIAFFGPGVAELFALIDETGSVRHASEKMGLSYSKAWKMIHGTEKAMERCMAKAASRAMWLDACWMRTSERWSIR